MLKAVGIGDVRIDLPNGAMTTPALLKDAVYAPDMAFTLISVSALDKANCSVMFAKGSCTIKNLQQHILAGVPLTNGVYRIAPQPSFGDVNYPSIASVMMDINQAHRRFGHIVHAAIHHAITSGVLHGIVLDSRPKAEFCEACAKAKSTRQPFPKESHTRAQQYGERVHWDLWGPASVQSLTGNFYVAARIDDATHETRLYFQKKKSETYNSYLNDEAYIENQTGNRIKTCRSDRGGEFLSKEFTTHQDSKGTTCKLTVHDSPQQNGTAERGMRTRDEQA